MFAIRVALRAATRSGSQADGHDSAQSIPPHATAMRLCSACRYSERSCSALARSISSCFLFFRAGRVVDGFPEPLEVGQRRNVVDGHHIHQRRTSAPDAGRRQHRLERVRVHCADPFDHPHGVEPGLDDPAPVRDPILLSRQCGPIGAQAFQAQMRELGGALGRNRPGRSTGRRSGSTRLGLHSPFLDAYRVVLGSHQPPPFLNRDTRLAWSATWPPVHHCSDCPSVALPQIARRSAPEQGRS